MEQDMTASIWMRPGENKVLVVTAGGANSISVAELAIFYMLYCSRNFKAVLNHYIEDYRYAKWESLRRN